MYVAPSRFALCRGSWVGMSGHCGCGVVHGQVFGVGWELGEVGVTYLCSDYAHKESFNADLVVNHRVTTPVKQ